jgi:hypothetical protein
VELRYRLYCTLICKANQHLTRLTEVGSVIFALYFSERVNTLFGLWEMTKSSVQKLRELRAGRYDSLSIILVSYLSCAMARPGTSDQHLALGSVASLRDSCFLICTLLDYGLVMMQVSKGGPFNHERPI